MRVIDLVYFYSYLWPIEENINRVSMEYFDEKGLRQFLKNCANLEKGILQKFINPWEEKNSNTIKRVAINAL